MITEDYVSFEIAKLLKEKGFDETVRCFYNIRTKILCDDCLKTKNSYTESIAAPTLQMAMKWLRKVHHLEMILNFGFPYGKFTYFWSVAKVHDDHLSYPMQDPEEVGFMEERVDTRKEACEGFIKYCCENLL